MDLAPVIFTEGDDFFEQLGKKYRKHDKGLFIMTPSGAGKTYYCNHQTEQHWIDGDILWIDAKAQPDPATAWWDKGVPVINRVEQRCDVITAEACDRGFWVMGSVNYWYQPNAIAIPPWDTLMRQIQHRSEHDYDGGMTPEHSEQVKRHIAIITEWHEKHGVPKFESIETAVSALTA
jgi:hypothetical protein